MSIDELLALPVTVDLETANRAIGLSRNVAYTMAQRNEYPVRVLRLGNRYRITRADLFRYLGIDAPNGHLASGGE